MRLRHKKWTDEVLAANKDIGINLADLTDEESLKKYTNLEIGSGLGGFLLAISKNNPSSLYLGVEININAFALAVKNAAKVKEEQKNFLLVNAPIERIFPLIGDEQLDNIYINFPDPWPKKKQHHRRLSYPVRLEEYLRMLKPGGHLYFRSDNVDLFEDSVEYFKTFGKFKYEIIRPFYSENVSYLPATEYERKFRAQGVDINLLIATK